MTEHEKHYSKDTTEAKKQAKAHWGYIKALLSDTLKIINGDYEKISMQDHINSIGFHYVSSYIHAFEHGKEYQLELLDNAKFECLDCGSNAIDFNEDESKGHIQIDCPNCFTSNYTNDLKIKTYIKDNQQFSNVSFNCKECNSIIYIKKEHDL